MLNCYLKKSSENIELNFATTKTYFKRTEQVNAHNVKRACNLENKLCVSSQWINIKRERIKKKKKYDYVYTAPLLNKKKENCTYINIYVHNIF
jgi:predicted small secreted protein